MKLICKNNLSSLYEDGENYRMVTKEGKDYIIPKKKNPVYPLALVLKWDFEPIDIEYLNKLAEEDEKNDRKD